MEPGLSYMSVFHPKPIYGDAACWRGSTPTPGMTALDENRRVSDRAGPYPDKRPPFQLAPRPSPVMTLTPVCAGIEQGCGRWQVSRETKGSNWNLVVGGGVLYPSSPCVDRAVGIAPGGGES